MKEHVNTIRRRIMLQKRAVRLTAAFKIAPDTGHEVGHIYGLGNSENRVLDSNEAVR